MTAPKVEEVVAVLSDIDSDYISTVQEWRAIQDAIALLSALEKDAARWRAVRNPKLNEHGIDDAPFVGVRGPGGISTFIEEFADSVVDTAIDLARGQS